MPDIVNLLLTVVGISASWFFSWYFYRKGIKQKRPVFWIEPHRFVIAYHTKKSWQPIQIQRSSGEIVKSDVIAIAFYFWNAGGEAIRSTDVLKPLTLRLTSDLNPPKIIDAKIIKQSREEIVQFQLNLIEEQNSLELSFDILESQDGAECVIVYEGDVQAKVHLDGAIEGIRYDLNTTFRPSAVRFLKTLMSRQVMLPMASLWYVIFHSDIIDWTVGLDIPYISLPITAILFAVYLQAVWLLTDRLMQIKFDRRLDIPKSIRTE